MIRVSDPLLTFTRLYWKKGHVDDTVFEEQGFPIDRGPNASVPIKLLLTKLFTYKHFPHTTYIQTLVSHNKISKKLYNSSSMQHSRH